MPQIMETADNHDPANCNSTVLAFVEIARTHKSKKSSSLCTNNNSIKCCAAYQLCAAKNNLHSDRKYKSQVVGNNNGVMGPSGWTAMK